MMPRQPIFFGWRVVTTAFAIAMFAWGTGFYGLSVFLRTLHAERNWSIASVSAAISVHFLVSAGLVAYLSDAHRRFGIVLVTRAGVVALAGGMLAWALADEPWQLFGAALLSGAGWAATSGAAINAMVAPWFNRKRAPALAMAFNGASVGGVVFMPLWVTLIARLGFAGAVSAVDFVMLAVLWPLIGLVLRPTPASLGLTPDGDEWCNNDARTQSHPIEPISRSALLLDRCFITMTAAFALGLFAQIGVVAHLLALLTPRLGETSAAGVISLSTASAIAGRTLLGWLLGTRDRRLTAAVNFAVQAFGVALIAVPAPPPLLPITGCVLFGLGMGNLVSLPPLIAQAEFEHSDVPQVVALTVAVNQSVFAFAPGVFGALHDITGAYLAPLLLAVAAQIGALALVLAGRRASWRPPARS